MYIKVTGISVGFTALIDQKGWLLVLFEILFLLNNLYLCTYFHWAVHPPIMFIKFIIKKCGLEESLKKCKERLDKIYEGFMNLGPIKALRNCFAKFKI